jgi:hypothetical protein
LPVKNRKFTENGARVACSPQVERVMRYVALIALLIILAASAAPVTSRAQGSGASPTAPVTGMKPDRTTADAATRKAMRAKEAALKQKRTECRKQARQKVALLKRRAFVKACMSRS